MPRATPLIVTIVGGIVLAFVLGAIANRLRVSPVVGYILAGVVFGPHTPGFVADQALAAELAEIGVILLMFGVGLHFSLQELLAVRRIATPGALAGIATGTLLGFALCLGLGWPVGAGIVFGASISVASTVVLVRALQERGALKHERGRIAVGWLVVEDLVMVLVLALVLMPALAALRTAPEAASGLVVAPAPSIGGIFGTLGITLGTVIGFLAIMLVVGRRVIPRILHFAAHSGSRELFRLAVLTVALGIAFGAAMLFDVSFALGAFLAGMVLSESPLSQRAAEETLPLRDAFAVLFFVSVGMLIDPMIIVREPGPVVGTLIIILIGKPTVAFFIVRAFGQSPTGALTIAASLAQIGEFSFIFIGLALTLDLLPEVGRDYVLAGAILSNLLNPALFFAAERLGARLEGAGAGPQSAAPDVVAPESVLRPTTLSGHAILIGHGRVGRTILDGLRKRAEPVLVIEERREIGEALQAEGTEVLIASALEPNVLTAANLPGARLLFVAIPNGFEAGEIVTRAKAENGGLRTIVRAHSDEEVGFLRQLGADQVILGETEIATGMLAVAFDPPQATGAPASPAPLGEGR
jgi:CPA2 family monovalent cation:H+ antiporter-2